MEINGHTRVLVRLPVELVEAIDRYVSSQDSKTTSRTSVIAQTLSEAFPLAMGPDYKYEGIYHRVGWRGKKRPARSSKLGDAP